MIVGHRVRFGRTIGAAALSISLAAAGCADNSAYSRKYGRLAARLYADHDYLRRSPAADFWALMPHYLPQRDERSCSLAVAAMVLNAARAPLDLPADEPLVTQDELLARLADPAWSAALAEGGQGVTLEQFAGLLRRCLDRYDITAFDLQVVHLDRADRAARARLRAALLANERTDRDLIVVNFLQSALTGDPQGAVGHLAPVAAFDAPRDRVLILDPDRRWYEPYWAPLDALLEGMSEIDPVSSRGRGYIHVRLHSSRDPAFRRGYY